MQQNDEGTVATLGTAVNNEYEETVSIKLPIKCTAKTLAPRL